MGLDANFANTKKAVKTTELDAEVTKTEYAQVCSSEKKKNKGNKSEGTIPDSNILASAKAKYKKTTKAVEAVTLAVTMEGANAFQFYGNLLLDEARQPWEKIIKAKVTCIT